MVRYLGGILCHSAENLIFYVFICLDVDVEKPDEKSVMTYVAQFLKYYPDPHHTVTDVPENDVSFSCITIKPV